MVNNNNNNNNLKIRKFCIFRAGTAGFTRLARTTILNSKNVNRSTNSINKNIDINTIINSKLQQPKTLEGKTREIVRLEKKENLQMHPEDHRALMRHPLLKTNDNSSGEYVYYPFTSQENPCNWEKKNGEYKFIRTYKISDSNLEGKGKTQYISTSGYYKKGLDKYVKENRCISQEAFLDKNKSAFDNFIKIVNGDDMSYKSIKVSENNEADFVDE